MMQGASSLPQHDQYAAHQHMALHNDMSASQTIGSIGSTIPPLPSQQSQYATPNLGSAVSSSMHLTNSSHESDVLGATSSYKTEHEMMYYSVNRNTHIYHLELSNPVYHTRFVPYFKFVALKQKLSINLQRNQNGFIISEYIIRIESYHRWFYQFYFVRR